ncbi:MAG: hypothetical protein IT493_08195 [Gammaproteobacteria bacterium]|nr:hypothetical protein [Gammaproteobacteria bacterium]
MRGIARIAMTGPLAATAVAAGFSLLALWFAPVLILSGATIGLVTLRHGALEGAKVGVMGLALAIGVLMAATGHVGRAGIVVLLPWVPIWCAAVVLRGHGSQGTALAMLGAFVAGFAYMLRQALGDVDAFWAERLEHLGAAVREQGGEFLSAQETAAIAGVMHEASVAVMCLSLGGMLLLARAWQAGLYRPGAFAEEFRALQLPRWVSAAGAALAVAALLVRTNAAPAGLVGDLFVVLVLLFAAQGLAVVHERTGRAPARRPWLIGVYVFAFLMPHIVATVLAVTGIADQVADFRQLRRARR